MQQNARSPGRKILIPKKRKIALVCSGGATKAGAFHLGVALALKEQGFHFVGGSQHQPKPASLHPSDEKMAVSTFVGSSAGAMITTYLATGYSLENIFNSFLGREADHPEELYPKALPSLSYTKMFRFDRAFPKEQIKELLKVKKLVSSILDGNIESFFQLKWLKLAGFFTTDGIEQYLREEVLTTNSFQDLIPELYIVGTQLNHSRKVVFGKYSFPAPPHDPGCTYANNVTISKACAASTALPLIYKPYPIDVGLGKEEDFIDGEVRETLSTHVAVDSGADLIISSYTHQPYHRVPELGSLVAHGIPAILVQSLYLAIEQKINNHIHNKMLQRNAIQAVSDYCKSNQVSEELRKNICNILESEFHHRMEVDSIYIHPRPSDAGMFFQDHFSLSPKKLAEIVKSGFRSAIDVLRKYEFEDRPRK